MSRTKPGGNSRWTRFALNSRVYVITASSKRNKNMYNVLLNRDIFQSSKSFAAGFFMIPENLLESATIPAGTLEFIQALLTRAETEWENEKDQVRRCYRLQFALETAALDAITRITVAAELLIKCNYVITYRMDGIEDRHLKSLRQPFVDQACRLIHLVISITSALQQKALVKEVENAQRDLASGAMMWNCSSFASCD